MPFINWFTGARGYDTEYLAARLLQYIANKYDGHSFIMRNGENEPFNEATAIFSDDQDKRFTGTLGHGICKQFHTDIEYLYAIRPDKVDVYSIDFSNNDATVTKNINDAAVLVQTVRIEPEKLTK